MQFLMPSFAPEHFVQVWLLKSHLSPAQREDQNYMLN